MNQFDTNKVYIIAAAGADAVKFQTFQIARLASQHAPKAAYQKKSTKALESQFSMLEKLELLRDWNIELQRHARQKGIEFLSTVFDVDCLKFLTELGMPLFKAPSGVRIGNPEKTKFKQKLGKFI